MRLFYVSEDVGDWIDKWAAKEGDGGFQDKAAEIKSGEILELRTRFEKEYRIDGICRAIDALEMLKAAEEDE